MAANKRKQDEKHLKILREMVTLPHNKYCFDCNQRGPTYVNMTSGSFVCTSCSGILRGLNPPHRVKSISMTSFTPEEMDFLKCHGNDLCRKVWLALYDSRLHSEADSKDEQKRKDFLVQKYERKRWHQAPTDAMLQDARIQNDTQAGKKETKPLKTLLGHNATRLVVSENQASARPAVNAHPPPPVQHHSTTANHSHDRRTVTPSLSQGSISSTGSQHSVGSSQPTRPGSTSTTTSTGAGGAFDLLADLGTDPFAPKAPPPPVQQPANTNHQGAGGFANFESAFNSNFPAAAPAPAVSAPAGPFGAPAAGAPQQQPNFGAFTNAGAPQPGLATSQAPQQQQQQQQQAAAPPGGGSASDRYAALADLDNLFGSSSGQAINWDGQFSSPPRNAAPSQMAAWNNQNAPNAQNAQQQQQMNSQASGHNPFLATTEVKAPNPFSGVPGNFGQSQSAPNPFAAAPMANQPSAFGQPAANQQPAFATTANQGFGAAPAQSHFSQSNSFPAFPAQNTNSFGQFPSSQSAFGGGEAQNNGFSGWSAQGQGQVKAGGFQAQGQGGFAQWGQPAQPAAAAPNPFMNMTAQQGLPAKSHSTNPFL